MKIPFGKYRGRQVDSLPRDYLTWLWEACDLREPLRSAVEEALSSGGDDSALTRTDLPPELKPVVQEIISHGYRSLSRKCHPDAGGTHTDMVRLNAAKAWLEEKAA